MVIHERFYQNLFFNLQDVYFHRDGARRDEDGLLVITGPNGDVPKFPDIAWDRRDSNRLRLLNEAVPEAAVRRNSRMTFKGPGHLHAYVNADHAASIQR